MTYKKLLYSYSQVYFENDRFYHLKDETRPTRYYSNYLDYKLLPSLVSLKEDLLYLKVEQKDYPTDYAMLFFPEKVDLPGEIKNHLRVAGFHLEKHLIFTCSIDNLSLSKKAVNGISIRPLSVDNRKCYLEYKYQQNLAYGKAYADEMLVFNEKHLPEPGSTVYLAFDGNQIIGDLTAWDYGQFVEMDDFSVKENYRGQGIGSALQKVASDGFPSAILIAEEINRNMYQHQGYEEVSYYWTALRSSDRN